MKKYLVALSLLVLSATPSSAAIPLDYIFNWGYDPGTGLINGTLSVGNIEVTNIPDSFSHNITFGTADHPNWVFTDPEDAKQYFYNNYRNGILAQVNAYVGSGTYVHGDVEDFNSRIYRGILRLSAANAFSGDYDDLTDKPTLFSGAYNDLTGKPTLFSGAYADLTGKPTLFDGTYAALTGIPSTFAPSAHTHAIADTTGLQTALDGKAASSHTHTISNVTGLQTALDAKFATPSGTTAQYVRGDGSLATLPTIPTVQAYEETTQRLGAFPVIKSATVSSGVAVFHLTADGTSGGTALCPNGPIKPSVQVIVNDAGASYQMGWAWTNTDKTLTVTTNNFTTANILTGLLGQAAANGKTVNATVFCK